MANLLSTRQSLEGREALPGSHVVYRLYNRVGQLLYIGMTKSLPDRLAGHQNTKHWYPAVSRVEISYFPDRFDAAEAEREAIRVEAPIYNVQHNGSWTPRPVAPKRNAELQPASSWWEGVKARLSDDGHFLVECVRRRLSEDAVAVLATIIADANSDGLLRRGKYDLSADANLINEGGSVEERRLDRAVRELMKAKLVGKRMGTYILQ